MASYSIGRKYSIEEILPIIQEAAKDRIYYKPTQFTVPSGKVFKLTRSIRCMAQSIICAECGIVGDHFAEIKQRNGRYELRLFAYHPKPAAGVHRRQKRYEKGFLTYMTADHLIPVDIGGSSIQANMATTCKECNCKKGSSIKHEFEERYRLATVKDVITEKYQNDTNYEKFFQHYVDYQESQRLINNLYLGYLTKQDIDLFLADTKEKYGYEIEEIEPQLVVKA